MLEEAIRVKHLLMAFIVVWVGVAAWVIYCALSDAYHNWLVDRRGRRGR